MPSQIARSSRPLRLFEYKTRPPLRPEGELWGEFLKEACEQSVGSVPQRHGFSLRESFLVKCPWYDKNERHAAQMKQPSTPQRSMPLTPPPSGSIDTATLNLLAAWRHQDATTDPEQIRAAEEELAEFKKAMNENRKASGEPLLFP